MDIDDGHNCGGSGTSEDHESETGANDCDAANDGEREEMRQAQTGKFTNNSKPNPSVCIFFIPTALIYLLIIPL